MLTLPDKYFEKDFGWLSLTRQFASIASSAWRFFEHKYFTRRHHLQCTPSPVPHLCWQAAVCICSSPRSTWSREDGGVVRCCHQGLVCIPSTAVEGRQDGSHLAWHSWSFTAARRRRPQPVHWKRHHQAGNRRAWPQCVHRCRADILWTCQTCHQQLLFPSATSPPNP